jgi:hypothetical protein
MSQRFNRQPLSLTGITPLQRYYERVRLPECRLYYLTVYRLDRTYSCKENTLGLPSSPNIHLIPCHGLGPHRDRIALPCPIRTIEDENTAFRQKDNVGLWDDKYFGAQSIHLRCRLTFPQVGFAPTGYYAFSPALPYIFSYFHLIYKIKACYFTNTHDPFA